MSKFYRSHSDIPLKSGGVIKGLPVWRIEAVPGLVIHRKIMDAGPHLPDGYRLGSKWTLTHERSGQGLASRFHCDTREEVYERTLLIADLADWTQRAGALFRRGPGHLMTRIDSRLEDAGIEYQYPVKYVRGAEGAGERIAHELHPHA